ncbi:hypothetical protein M2360_001794 [Rhizobium sp. SG_E_25_P2]|uniref:hypothetical protein n=1 Tax=Rhizobium sp. SG_E_25_P2 TaxID=2879942 RepID=UPI0024763E39|nr:hypothetical protein [Rhizobium sp. SG_E_25_P2]MDH6266398.1 hypothetical protein [Rhizobium sp. SG_E_25_P2]
MLKTRPLLFLVFAVWFAPGAQAHVFSPPADVSGVPIPSISHGEMAVLSRYRGEVMDLAEQTSQRDAEIRALLMFTGLQSANCAWGLVPGSVTDEANPLNECAHAELAGVKAILLKLRDLPAAQPMAGDLVSRIDREMTLAGAALIQCEFSAEGFNTASPVVPDWGAVGAYLWQRFGKITSVLIATLLATLAAIAVLRAPGRRAGPLG